MSLPSCSRRFAYKITADILPSPRTSSGLSFLYNTPTILSQTVSRRRNLHTYSPSDSVPFDDAQVPVARKPRNLNDIISGKRGTSVTEAERKVFEQIFYDAEQQKDETSSVDQLVSNEEDLDDEDILQIEEEEEDPMDIGRPRRGKKAFSNDTDDFLKAIAGIEKNRKKTLGPSYLWPQETQKTMQHAEKQMKAKIARKAPKFLTHTNLLKQRQQTERIRVSNLVRRARTDFELWNILETEVFAPVRALRLDDDDAAAVAAAASASTASIPDDTSTDAIPKTVATLADLAQSRSRASYTNAPHLAIIGPTYPSVMVLALRVLRHRFPSSTLPLSVLPAMRSLGRSSFVLGASTSLYHQLIIHYWLKYSDLSGINALLEEMANGVVEFNHTTLDLLQHITREVFRARDGQLGPVMKALWGMDMFTDALGEMWRWRERITKELPDEKPVQNWDSGEGSVIRPVYRTFTRKVFTAPSTF